MSDTIQFWIPLTLAKSTKSKEGKKEMRIAGYASTSNEDRQGDSVVQKGLNIDNFLNYGFFNWNHEKSKILGYPDKEKTRIDSKGFYVEGVLLDDIPLAREVYEASLALQKSNTTRRLGFSIEGTVGKRDSLGKILQADVYNVAITDTPVNPNATWEAIQKSFSTEKVENKKSMSAGYDISIGETNSGSSLKKEDLERTLLTISKALEGDEEANKALDTIRAKLDLQKSNLDVGSLVLYYQLTKGLSRVDSVKLVKSLMSNIIQRGGI